MLWAAAMTRALSARLLSALALLVVLFAGRAAFAASPETRAEAPRSDASADPLFPSSGHFSAAFASGVPFVGAGELAYGFGDRFAMGAMVGLTPNMGNIQGTAGVGLRPRVVVFRSGAWQSTIVAPVLYYPRVPGFGGELDPWMLAQPTLTLERSFGSDGDGNVHVGVGALASTCLDTVLTLGKEKDMMTGVWNTATVGGAIRVSPKTMLFAEGGVVLRGYKPANDWMGGPAIAFVGVQREL
jgi:hypothetical protein